MTQKQPINQITEGVIWKQLLLFFFPILLGTFFQQLYNTIDTVIVGQFVGKAALASVGGSSAQIVALIVGFFTGLSSGASVLIAQYFGARNEHAASDGLHNAYAISIVGGILLGIIGFFATPSMLRLMNTPDEIMQDSVIYLRIYFAGIIFVFLYNMGSSILRAVGDSKRPLYYLIACCLLNIILDVLFVVAFHMGVLGVAVATLISQAFSALLVTRKLLRSEGMLKLSFSRIRFHGSVLKNQLKLGLPTGFEAILFAITNIAIQSAVNTFGTDTSAAWSAYGKLDAIFWMVSTAFGISITTFVGQNYGAGQLKRGRDGVKKTLYMSIIVTAALTVLTMIFSGPLLSLFNDDPGVIEYGKKFVLIISPFYVTICFNQVFAGALRGIGRSTAPMIIMLSSFVAFRQLFLYCNKAFFGHSFIGTALAYPMGWVVCSILMIICYKRSALGKASDDAAGAVVK